MNFSCMWTRVTTSLLEYVFSKASHASKAIFHAPTCEKMELSIQFQMAASATWSFFFQVRIVAWFVGIVIFGSMINVGTFFHAKS